jgi:guanylate kinase
MRKGKLIVLSGPSGSGKDTVLAQLLKKDKDITLSISSITRPMRVGEVEGEKYHFISREEFERIKETNFFDD